jgi:hypothetical protein
MSWELTLMSDWTSAGGVPLENLGPAREGSQLRRELSQRGEATLVLDRDLAWHLATPRAIIRIDGVRDGFTEVRVTDRALQTRGVEATRFRVTGLPRIYDLASAGLIYEELGGRKIFTFNEALTRAQYLSRFFLQRQSERRLVGLSPRLVANTERVPLQWSRWNSGELLDALLSATQDELQWVTDGADEFIDLVDFVGSDAVTVPLYFGDRLRDHQLEEDYRDMGTVARVAGDAPTADSERANIGENLWDVVGRRTLDDGTVAVEIRAPGTTESPLLEDDQYAAAPDVGLPARYLQREDGTTRLAILGSDAAASELIVSAGAPLVGERVSIVADSTGAPLETLELPSAVRAYGFIERDVQIAGGRGERQYARNGGHEAGLARWSAVNAGAGAEYLRTEFGVTLAALANGARAAATGTGTPFAIKGLTPGTNIRKGMELRVGGAICAVQSAAIASTTGVLVLGISPGLPAPYPDSTPLTLVRRESRALELDGAQSPLNPVLNFRDVDTDGLRRIDPAESNALTSGDYEGTGVFAYSDAPVGSFTARQAGKVGCQLAGLTWSTYDDDVFDVTPTEIVSGVFGFVMTLKIDPALITAGTVSVGTRLRYTAQPGDTQFNVLGGPFAGYYATWTVRVTAAAGDTITVTAEVPAGATGVVLGQPANSGGSITAWDATNVTLADGLAWTLVVTKESRPVLLDGSYSLGATTVTCKPQTIIARRNFAGGDAIELVRTLSVYARILSGTVTTETDAYGFTFYRLTATIDLAFSTVQNLSPAQLLNWAPRINGEFSPGSPITLYWNAESLSGTTLTLTSGNSLSPYVGPFPVDTDPETMLLFETYGVSSATAWSTAARTVLTLSAAIPAGRAYSRGALVWANWHTRAAHGASPSLRLFAAVAAGDPTVELLGGDNVTSATANPLTTGVATCYRVAPTGSTIPIAGNVLYAAASTVADGSGNASVTLVAANPAAIINNEAVTIPIPPMVPAGLELTASALRLFCAVGGLGEPLTATGGQTHDLAYVRVPAGSTRTITAISLFTLSAGEWFAGQGPVLALVDAAGTILGYQRLGDDGLVVESAPGVVTLTAQATIAQSGLYGFRVYGGASADYSRWCVHLRTFFYLGEATDAPYTPTSWPTRLMLAGLKKLDQLRTPRITDRLTLDEWNAAQLTAAGVPLAGVPPVVLGGRVHLEEWDRVVRVIAYTERPDMPVADVEIGQLARDGSRIITQTALAAAPQGVR